MAVDLFGKFYQLLVVPTDLENHNNSVFLGFCIPFKLIQFLIEFGIEI